MEDQRESNTAGMTDRSNRLGSQTEDNSSDSRIEGIRFNGFFHEVDDFGFDFVQRSLIWPDDKERTVSAHTVGRLHIGFPLRLAVVKFQGLLSEIWLWTNFMTLETGMLVTTFFELTVIRSSIFSKVEGSMSLLMMPLMTAC